MPSISITKGSVVAVLSVLGFAVQKRCDVWLVKEL